MQIHKQYPRNCVICF